MLKIRTSLVAVLLSLALNGAAVGGCDKKPGGGTQNTNQSQANNQPTPAPAPTPVRGDGQPGDSDLKILAQGGYSRMTDAFVVVARDAETYAALRRLVNELPEMNAAEFQSNAVVAAFLGQRRTGGYGVSIVRTAENRVRIAATAPPRGSITTQALTAPFKIASVPVSAVTGLTFELDGSWRAAARPYRLKTGEFTMQGGIAGRGKSFKLEGEIGIMRQGNLATFVFDLKSAGGDRERSLKDVASGIVHDDGNLTGLIVDPGSLIDAPRSPLRAAGGLTGGENNLALTFESLPSRIADSFNGQGRLEATATAPPPPKSRPSEDAPM
ncbi:MAG TPA: protease complex subunit PrcB family protein [Pyrinomonadaceae bacterium]|jgi:hypothetical protein